MNAQPLLVDTVIFIAMERQPGLLANWFSQQADVATCDAVRAEFLIGVHAASKPATRETARRFFAETIAALPSLPIDHADFDEAGRLIGEAIRNGKAKPTLGDGLIAACAIRHGRTVLTDNTLDFAAMGVTTLKIPFPLNQSQSPG
jgi:predicted nucleic acid-binding protein